MLRRAQVRRGLRAQRPVGGRRLLAIREAGRRVPDDVAIVGFDDIPIAAHTEPSLTTVRQPLREMGEAAARMLMGHFDGTSLAPVS